MKLSEAGELSLIDAVRKKFSRTSPSLICGIGDDAAVIRPSGKKMLLTSDMMVEGIHFDLSWTTPFQLGYKLVSVNVSDIYAMGGTPEFILLNFAAKGDFTMKDFRCLYEGIEKASDVYGISLIGGDMSASERLILSAVVTGYAKKVIYRSGAQFGDKIYVSGPLGDSACGLEMLKRIGKAVEIEKGKSPDYGPGPDVIAPLIQRHVMPLARDPGKFRNVATSMMDISDGLLLDLSRLCKESGVGARLYAVQIPVSSELIKASEYLGASALHTALSGGEDYELLFTAPPNAKVAAYCIGEITRRKIIVADSRGRTMKTMIKGYQHFKA